MSQGSIVARPDIATPNAHQIVGQPHQPQGEILMSEDLMKYLRIAVAKSADLPEGMANRLRGDNLADLEADAAALMADLDSLRPEPTPSLDGGFRGAERTRALSGGNTLDYWRNLARTDPDAFNAAYERGEVTF
jgi:hypothetical protein